MIVGLLAGAYLLLLCAASLAIRPYDTYVSPVTVVGFAGFLYLVGIPVEIEITGVRYLRLGHSVFISPEVGRETAGLAILAFGSWFAGYWMTIKRDRRVQNLLPLQNLDSRIVKTALIVAALGGAGLLLAFYPAQVVAAHDYASQFNQRFSLPVYSLLISFTGVALAMLGFVYAWERSRGWLVALALAAALVWWGFYSNGKDPIVVAGLSLSAIYIRRWQKFTSVVGFLCAVIGGLAGAAVGTLFFSVYRGGSTDVRAQFDRTGLLVGVEPAGPMYSVVDQLSDTWGPRSYSWGQSVMDAFVSWIPRAIWPSRPDDLAESFAQGHIADWTPGRGYGYSPVSEGLLNGGVVGVALLFVLMGVIVAAVRNLLLSPSASGEARLLSLAFFAVYVLELCFIMYRGPFSLLVTNLVQGFGFYLVIRMGMKLLGKRTPVASSKVGSPRARVFRG